MLACAGLWLPLVQHQLERSRADVAQNLVAPAGAGSACQSAVQNNARDSMQKKRAGTAPRHTRSALPRPLGLIVGTRWLLGYNDPPLRASAPAGARAHYWCTANCPHLHQTLYYTSQNFLAVAPAHHWCTMGVGQTTSVAPQSCVTAAAAAARWQAPHTNSPGGARFRPTQAACIQASQASHCSQRPVPEECMEGRAAEGQTALSLQVR